MSGIIKHVAQPLTRRSLFRATALLGLAAAVPKALADAAVVGVKAGATHAIEEMSGLFKIFYGDSLRRETDEIKRRADVAARLFGIDYAPAPRIREAFITPIRIVNPTKGEK